MSLNLRHAVRSVALGLGSVSLHVSAAVDPSKVSPVTDIIEVSGRSVDLLMPEAGVLVSAVLIALVVIARRTKRHD
jgi:hypothetical protein